MDEKHRDIAELPEAAREIVAMCPTPHGAMISYRDGTVILSQRDGDKMSWVDITPQWGDDGVLIRKPVARL